MIDFSRYMRRISISPDGTRVVFVRADVDLGANTKQSDLWMVAVGGVICVAMGKAMFGGLGFIRFVDDVAEQGLLDARLSSLRQQMGRVFLPGEHPQMQQVRRQLDGYFEHFGRSEQGN